VIRKTNLVLTLAVCVLAGACGRKIGDKCRDAIDCNNEDITRTCDPSQPGGYCTIEGCDEKSCPGDSVCIRFFPDMKYLDKLCVTGDPKSCDPNELCIAYPPPAVAADAGSEADAGAEADAAAPMPPPNGRCVPRSTEKRNCLATCDDDGDCREEYACRTSGEGATEALTPTPRAIAKYCAPR
jgi:hypothetical protein